MTDAAEALKASVLELLDEDDLGVYEVWWFANSQYPDLPLSMRLALAEEVVTELVTTDIAHLVASPWPDGPIIGTGQPVDDLRSVLRSSETWVLSSNQVIWLVRNEPE